MLIKRMPVYCCLLWIPDVGDVMTDMRWARERVKVSEEYFHRLASPDREAG